MLLMLFSGYDMWLSNYDEKETEELRKDMQQRAAAKRAEVQAEAAKSSGGDKANGSVDGDDG